jgi:hypothetical protein
VVVDARDEAVAEELVLVTSNAEVVLDVSGGFFEVERSEVVADGDALMEGLVRGEAELVGQVRLAEEDEGDEGSGVHLVVEEEAQLVEELRREEMSFVDDQQDVAAFASQIVEGVAELREEADEVKGRFDLKGEKDVVVEGGDAEVGIGEIDDGIDVGVEGVSEGADGSGFAGADVAGDEGREALLKGEGQAALDFAVAVGGVQVFAENGTGERGVAETVEVIEGGHRSHFPPQSW